jgi:superfamily II DNA or RNA helicase
MKDKIVVVAAHIGAGKTVLSEAIASHLNKDVVFITPEQAKQEAIIYERQPPLPPIFEDKQFVCKGKHQYRDVKGKWICQCGKSL